MAVVPPRAARTSLRLNGVTDTITGDYNLRGTSGKRFFYNAATIATRNSRGEVISGYAAVDGKAVLPLGAEQKTGNRRLSGPDPGHQPRHLGL